MKVQIYKVFAMLHFKNYRRKLYTFRDYLGYSVGYTFFNDYYVEKMNELEHKYNVLENGGVETAIATNTK